jgi:DNA polymerase-3 subunit epsilon
VAGDASVTAKQLLADLRARGEPVALGEVAARLLAAAAPLEPRLARPIVAAALGRPGATLPDPLPPEALEPLPPGGADPTPLERAAFAVVDLETTGLSTEHAAIIEIGAVRIEGLRVRDCFETLVDPRRPLSPAITRLTGIDDAMLAGAPTGGDALRSFRTWLDRTPGAVFVAHNARFDAGFVRRGFSACALPPLDEPTLCTRLLARRLAPELRRFGLDRVAEGFGLRFRARHRALGDAEVTAEALLQLLERAREGELRTLGDLVRLQAAPPPKLPRHRAQAAVASRRSGNA